MNGYANGGTEGTATVVMQNPNTTITSTGPINLTGSASGDDVITLGVGWNIGTNVLMSGSGVYGYQSNTPAQLTLSGNLLTGGTNIEIGDTEMIGRTSYTLGTNSTQVTLVIAGGAANLNWTGANGTSWDTQTTTNWYNTGGASNDVFYSGDNVTFATNSPVVVTNSGVSAGQIIVSNSPGTSFVMSGGDISAQGMTINGGGTFTASNNFALSTAPLVVTNGSDVILSGSNAFSSITVGGASTVEAVTNTALGTVTINLSGGSTLVVDQGIANNVSSADSATISDSNSVLAGSLAGAGTFTINSGSGTTVLGTNSSSLTGRVIIPVSNALQVGTGNTSASLGSAIVLNNGLLAINLSGNLTLANSISGTGELSDVGAGTLTLSGSNSYSGGTFIATNSTVVTSGGSTLPGNVTNNGVLQVSVSSGSSASLGGVISGTGSLTKNVGAGTIVLTGSNTYTGGTTVSTGTIQIGDGGADGNILGSITTTISTNNGRVVVDRSDTYTITNAFSGSGTLAQGGNGTLIIGFSNGPTGVALALNSVGAIKITNASALGSSSLSVTAAPVGSSVASLISDLGTGSTFSITNAIGLGQSAQLAFVMPTNETVIADAGGISGKGVIQMSGNGTLELNNTSSDTWANGTFISSGTLLIGPNGSTNVYITNGVVLNGGTFDLGGTTNNGGANADTFTDGTIKNGTFQNLKSFNFNGPVNFLASISGASNSTITASNTPYTVNLSGTNDSNYTGNWTIQSNGILKMGNATVLGTGTLVTVQSGGTLDLNGYSYTPATVMTISGSGQDSNGAVYSSISGAALNGTVNLNGSASIGTVGTLTVGANISDGVNVTNTNNVSKTFTVGAGTLNLNGSNNFATGVVATNAIENVGSSNSLGATNALTVNGTLNLNSFYAGFTPTLTNVTLGGGTLTSSGTTLALATNQTLAGYGTVTTGSGAGTLTLNGSFSPSVGQLLTVNGGLVLGSTATYNSTLNYTNDTSGNNYFSQVTVNGGHMNLSGSLLLNGTIFSVSNGISSSPFTTSFSAQLYNLTNGAVTSADFNAVAWTGIDSGSSNPVTLSFTSSGANMWTYTDTAGDVATFNSVNGNLAFAPIPEPSESALLGMGLISVIALVIRRQRKAV